MNRQERLYGVCRSRGLPQLKIGAECEVDGRKGIIVGGNNSNNIDVLFDGVTFISNCHPYYKMRIFNGMGGVCFVSDYIQDQPATAQEGRDD